MPSISFLKSIALVGALTLGVSAAQAATYDFSFTTGATVKTVTGVEVTPLNLTGINGASFASSAAKTVNSAGSVTTTVGSGLGLTLLGSAPALNSPMTIDAVTQTVREMLLFTFNRAVRLVSVTLAGVTDLGQAVGGPKVAIFADPAIGGASGFTGADIMAANGTVTMPGIVDATTMGVGARMDSAFYIAGITVEDIPSEVSPVPLPAGGLLLGSLALVPFLRRKRRA